MRHATASCCSMPRGGDVVHCHSTGSTLGDQPPRGIEQQLAVACRIAALLGGLAGHRQLLVGGDHV